MATVAAIDSAQSRVKVTTSKTGVVLTTASVTFVGDAAQVATGTDTSGNQISSNLVRINLSGNNLVY